MARASQLTSFIFIDLDKGQRDGVRERHHVLQGEGRHEGRDQRG